MNEGIEKKEERIVNRLLEEAADLFFSEIEPRQKRGEISDSVANSILESLAEANDMPDNNPEKLNIIEHQMNNMKRIFEQGTHIEQNKSYGFIPEKKKPAEKFEFEGEGVPLPYTDYSEKEIPEAPEPTNIIEETLKPEMESLDLKKEESHEEIQVLDENLLNFRKDVQKVWEDLQEQREAQLDDISETNNTLDSLVNEGLLSNEAEYSRLVNKRTVLNEELAILDNQISFYELLEKSNDPEKDINEAFVENIIDEDEKDELLRLLNPEYKPKEEESEVLAAVSSVQEERSKSEPEEETDEERAERLNRDYLHPEDIFFDAVAKWFTEKEDLYDRGKISEEEFGEIESLHEKLIAPVSFNNPTYSQEIENAYDTGVITEEDYETLYPLAVPYTAPYKEYTNEDYLKDEKAKEEEEEFLKNLDKPDEDIKAEVSETELKKQRELRKKARKLGVDLERRGKKGLTIEDQEEIERRLEEIRQGQEIIPDEILGILDDASGFKALAKWYLKKLREQENYDEKARKYVEKLGKFLADKNKKVSEYHKAREEYKGLIERKKQELENVPDDNIILRPVRNTKTTVKIKDLLDLKEKFGEIIRSLESHLEDNYDRGKITTKEYNNKARGLKRIYKSQDVEEIKSTVEDYFKKGIINKQDKKEIFSNLNGYVKK